MSCASTAKARSVSEDKSTGRGVDTSTQAAADLRRASRGTDYPRARQLDFFIAPLADLNWRDQRDTMERPFFALSKSRKTPIVYTSPKGDVTVEVSPNVKYGMATIWDFDVLIWAASQVNAMIERGESAKLDELQRTKTLYFQPADLLRAIDRNTGGKDREELRAALDRLASTYVKTNIRQHHQGRRRDGGFTWIDAWDEETDTQTGHSRGMSITLSQWFLMGVLNQGMLLAMDADYFRLTGGYQRWLYRIARKHAHGTPEGWTFTLTTLHQKSGSDQAKAHFKRDLKRVVEKGPILGYGLEWIEGEKREEPKLRIYPLADSERIQQLVTVHARRRRTREADAALLDEPGRFAELIHPAKLEFLKEQHPGVDLAELFGRFVLWNRKRGAEPRDVLAAFSGFIREHQHRQRQTR